MVPVHGDFHSSQLLVSDRGVEGLVDVDTAGIGHRSDDLATLLAHLDMVAMDSPRGAAVRAYGSSVARVFDRIADPGLLRRKVAAAILGFATGPFWIQQPGWPRATQRRLMRAEAWLDAAELC